MRTIKFRGKTELTGEWVYGFFSMGSSVRFEHPKQDERIVPRYLIDDGLLHDVIPETVGQYTGLTDKDGKEIYEGDIVQSESGEFVYQVVFNETRFASFGLKRKQDMFLHYFGEAIEADNCEVIGNVFDNPELLKGGDK